MYYPPKHNSKKNTVNNTRRLSIGYNLQFKSTSNYKLPSIAKPAVFQRLQFWTRSQKQTTVNKPNVFRRLGVVESVHTKKEKTWLQSQTSVNNRLKSLTPLQLQNYINQNSNLDPRHQFFTTSCLKQHYWQRVPLTKT